jgi:hypothetical protein
MRSPHPPTLPALHARPRPPIAAPLAPLPAAATDGRRLRPDQQPGPQRRRRQPAQRHAAQRRPCAAPHAALERPQQALGRGQLAAYLQRRRRRRAGGHAAQRRRARRVQGYAGSRACSGAAVL